VPVVPVVDVVLVVVVAMVSVVLTVPIVSVVVAAPVEVTPVSTAAVSVFTFSCFLQPKAMMATTPIARSVRTRDLFIRKLLMGVGKPGLKLREM